MIAIHITSLILKHETEKIKIVFTLGTLFSRRKKSLFMEAVPFIYSVFILFSSV